MENAQMENALDTSSASFVLDMGLESVLLPYRKQKKEAN